MPSRGTYQGSRASGGLRGLLYVGIVHMLTIALSTGRRAGTLGLPARSTFRGRLAPSAGWCIFGQAYLGMFAGGRLACIGLLAIRFELRLAGTLAVLAGGVHLPSPPWALVRWGQCRCWMPISQRQSESRSCARWIPTCGPCSMTSRCPGTSRLV
eukprot:2823647-Heterocapsa_arctica.AAC.1